MKKNSKKSYAKNAKKKISQRVQKSRKKRDSIAFNSETSTQASPSTRMSYDQIAKSVRAGKKIDDFIDDSDSVSESVMPKHVVGKRGINTRRVALEILASWRRSPIFIDKLLVGNNLYKYLSSRNKAFLQNIVYGTLRNEFLLDFWLSKFCKKSSINPKVINHLRLAFYELFILENQPYAIANEYAELAPHALKSFVNGVIRTADREGKNRIPSSDQLPLGLRYSIPKFLVDRWTQRFGENACEQFLQTINQKPPICFTLNPFNLPNAELQEIIQKENSWQAIHELQSPSSQQVQKKDDKNSSYDFKKNRSTQVKDDKYFKKQTKKENYKVRKNCQTKTEKIAQTSNIKFSNTNKNITREPITFGEERFYFAHKAPLSLLDKGQVYVQDPVTELAAVMLEPKVGELILDACAAPGGKTFSLARLVKNKTKIFATDVPGSRLLRLRKNCKSLRLNVETFPCDWSKEASVDFALKKTRGKLFDKILLDLPCSNTGVIRRRVDLRWQLREKTFAQLIDLQMRILRRVSTLLKPGGRLAYSTCSIEAEENSLNVNRFLKSVNNFVLVSSNEIRPWVHACDGAYVAILQKF